MTGPVAPAVPSTILAVHNRYKQHGGEDVVFDAETALLEAHGHRVERFVVDNEQIDERPGFGEALGLAARTVWSVRAARVLRNRVRRLRPDLVHVHNFFPLLSPSIYSACRSEGAAVVQTLHNYRLVCPVATLYRDGHPCEDCLGRAFAWPGIIHACYRESASASAAVATMLAFHRARRTWSRDVDLYVAVSAFLRSKLVEGLLEPDRVVVKPNFVRGTAEPGSNPDGPFLYVGRLSPDKGIETLLEAWAHVPSHVNLRIVGDGPLGP
ncbi:MAG TPA: glycosyltransferase, partial [Candidatus Limnocylindrales bacterium]